MNILRLCFLFLLAGCQTYIWGQHQLAQDPQLVQQLYASGLIHQPLPLDTTRSHETAGWNKKVLRSLPLSAGKTDTLLWSHDGEGHLYYCPQTSITGQGSICLQFPTSTGRRAVGPENDPDYAMYGHSAATYRVGGKNWERYNRLVFYIYPDCEGARVVNINVTFTNADTPAKEGYNRPSGSHLVNLVNKQWNRCYLEIDEYQRDQVESLTFSVNLQGKDRTTGNTNTYYIDNLQLQTVEQPDKTCGWMPQEGKIIYSGTGYFQQGRKTAFMAANTAAGDPTFRLVTARPFSRAKANRPTPASAATLSLISANSHNPASICWRLPPANRPDASASATVYGKTPNGGCSISSSANAAAIPFPASTMLVMQTLYPCMTADK